MDQTLLSECRVLPVVTVRNVESTVALSRALAKGGMKAVEITLRTDAALECIAAVKAQVPNLLIAAGTVTNPAEFEAAVAAGADFCVSPGLTENLLRAASQTKVGFVPGISTASEIMLGLDYGYECFKLFPAVAVGGIPTLKSLGGPFPQVRFCPTGGLTPFNFREFLALSNVVCCGGSWMVADKLVDAENWAEIERLAHEAMN
ncbi:MAG: 2-dehydro-3-deoxyphosphogluconate aldolase/(4S)-4-hydroxy-2-oxoglutarate aldolase [Halioglobus sp.]|jgi:2-dehydro-3-deoxyphosphogluconate aldolase/(4S)-4-hydroxy-2-oxoglutarate aldolase